MYVHMRAAMRMMAGNPPQDRHVVARTRRALLAPSFLCSHQTLAYGDHVRSTHANQVKGELESRYDFHFCYSSGCENGNSDVSDDGYGYNNRWRGNGRVGEDDGLVP